MKTKANKGWEMEKKSHSLLTRKKPQDQIYKSLAELYSPRGYCRLNPAHAEVNWNMAIDLGVTRLHLTYFAT